MKFRVSSIAWEEESRLISKPMLLLEDWLNSALADGHFGGELRNLMILIITHHPDDDANRPRKISRLSTYKDPFSGQTETVLALHIHIDAIPLLKADPQDALRLLSQEIVEHLPIKPLRTPKNLEYSRLRLAITKSIQAEAPRVSRRPVGLSQAVAA